MSGVADRSEAERRADMRVVAALLRGGSTVFGSRIEVVWPDGAPYGKSDTELADIIDPPDGSGRTLPLGLETPL